MKRIASVFVVAMLAVVPAMAQHQGGGHAAAPAAGQDVVQPQGPFSVMTYGAFRNFMQKQDFRATVGLGAAKATGATDGVGALSNLRGEITMVDGRYILSYGGGCKEACPAPHEESAALLGTGTVSAWADPVILSEPLAGKALDDVIIATAKAAGLDMAKPFPVRLKGTLTGLVMHVIEAPMPGFSGHDSKVHMAKQDEFRHETLPGLVVGFYVPSSMHGTLSHPGEPFHFHWLDEARTRTAHLDAFGMARGAELILPKR